MNEHKNRIVVGEVVLKEQNSGRLSLNSLPSRIGFDSFHGFPRRCAGLTSDLVAWGAVRMKCCGYSMTLLMLVTSQATRSSICAVCLVAHASEVRTLDELRNPMVVDRSSGDRALWAWMRENYALRDR